jgi:hypothetical protein
MNLIPEGLLARLSLGAISALDDLDHNCDLIAVRPSPAEIVWTLERAGVDATTVAEIRSVL